MPNVGMGQDNAVDWAWPAAQSMSRMRKQHVLVRFDVWACVEQQRSTIVSYDGDTGREALRYRAGAGSVIEGGPGAELRQTPILR